MALRRCWQVMAVATLVVLPGLAGATPSDPEEKPASGGASLTTRVRGELAGYTDSDAVTVFTPSLAAQVTDPLRGWTARGSYLADIVSAASVDVVSTASQRWNEVRHAATLGATYQPHPLGASLDASYSTEPDYVSAAAGGHLLLQLAERNVNPVLGYTYSHDTAGRTGTPFSVFSQDLARHAVDAGVELVLDRATTAFLGVNAVFESGDQKKPYRYLPIFAPGEVPNVLPGASLAFVNQTRLPGRMAERTPLERDRFAVSARVARRFERSTFVASERVYADDWGLVANTSQLQYFQDLGKRFVAWVHLRGHLQSGVSFWERAYAARITTEPALFVPEYRTGDRELSPLFAGTAGAGARWNFGSFARPSAWGIALQFDGTATDFRDTLYVTNRLSGLGMLQLEAEL